MDGVTRGLSLGKRAASPASRGVKLAESASSLGDWGTSAFTLHMLWLRFRCEVVRRSQVKIDFTRSAPLSTTQALKIP